MSADKAKATRGSPEDHRSESSKAGRSSLRMLSGSPIGGTITLDSERGSSKCSGWVVKPGGDYKVMTDKAKIDEQAAEYQAIVRKMKQLISDQALERTKIQRQIEKLQAELQQKSHEFEIAQKKLSELRPGVSGKLEFRNAATIKKGESSKPRIELQFRTEDGQLKAKGHGVGVGVKSQNPDQKQKRLEELESSLRKLLEEVASLKKQSK